MKHGAHVQISTSIVFDIVVSAIFAHCSVDRGQREHECRARRVVGLAQPKWEQDVLAPARPVRSRSAIDVNLAPPGGPCVAPFAHQEGASTVAFCSTIVRRRPGLARSHRKSEAASRCRPGLPHIIAGRVGCGLRHWWRVPSGRVRPCGRCAVRRGPARARDHRWPHQGPAAERAYAGRPRRASVSPDASREPDLPPLVALRLLLGQRHANPLRV